MFLIASPRPPPEPDELGAGLGASQGAPAQAGPTRCNRSSAQLSSRYSPTFADQIRCSSIAIAAELLKLNSRYSLLFAAVAAQQLQLNSCSSTVAVQQLQLYSLSHLCKGSLRGAQGPRAGRPPLNTAQYMFPMPPAAAAPSIAAHERRAAGHGRPRACRGVGGLHRATSAGPPVLTTCRQSVGLRADAPAGTDLIRARGAGRVRVTTGAGHLPRPMTQMASAMASPRARGE
jgi:hypothetical protein